MTPLVFNDATPWAIVVFAARESPGVLVQTIQAAARASSKRAHIDVLVNGNLSLAQTIADELGSQQQASSNGQAIRVWSLTQGDKANTWNQYFHHVWSGEALSFFIDGYVRLNPDAIQLLGDAVSSSAHALGGTGVPSMGRTAAAMRAEMTKNGGFHGNFCCIQGDVIRQIRRRGIALPFGLYRVDSLVGALLLLGLHPESNKWDRRRILVHPDASWQTDQRHWWRLSDLRAQVKRVFRQARGLLENEAVKDLFMVQKVRAEQLPANAATLVSQWIEKCPDQAGKMLNGSVLAKKALADLKRSANSVADGSRPTLISCSAIG